MTGLDAGDPLAVGCGGGDGEGPAAAKSKVPKKIALSGIFERLDSTTGGMDARLSIMRGL